MEFKNILSNTASICTILQFLAPIWTCRQYAKDRTTGDSSSLSFACAFLSSCLWLKYGLILGETSLITVNLIGAILQFCYLTTFYFFSPRKNLVLMQLAGASCVLVLSTLYTSYETNDALLKDRIGLLCSMVTIMFFAAPLSQLAYVIRVKSSECLPFVLILATFIVCSQWFAYGVLISNPYIQIPNALGCILCAFQLSLFLIYPSSRSGSVE